MSAKRLVMLVLGAILVLFGAACINYTKPSALEHHQRWAAQHHAPPPSDTVLIGGVVSVATGVGLLGLGLSWGRRSR